ncbi:hypothetical protein Q9Q99_15610 [Curtobacterium flaccumfaciens]|nr:hypothetical protein Q9Q99_15610 [Curtobacterium flaccumfaciens]
MGDHGDPGPPPGESTPDVCLRRVGRQHVDTERAQDAGEFVGGAECADRLREEPGSRGGGVVPDGRIEGNDLAAHPGVGEAFLERAVFAEDHDRFDPRARGGHPGDEQFCPGEGCGVAEEGHQRQPISCHAFSISSIV